MRFLVCVVLAACGGSSPHAASHGSTPTSGAEPASVATEAPAKAPTKPVGFPVPPEGPAPKGTWRVTVEFPHLQARATSVAADGTGVYVAGMVLTSDDFRSRRWAVAKLDGNGALA